MITNSRVSYVLSYCRDGSYAMFVSGVKDGLSVNRICFLGIEDLRAYLSLEHGVPRLDFFKRMERTWERVTRIPRSRELNLHRMLHSYQGFESELAETFFFAYPRAEESYYEDLPGHKDVLSALHASPTESKAKGLRLLCSYDGQTAVDEADGVVSIVCEDGTLCIPYDTQTQDKVFQMDRAKFHPDMPLSDISERFFDRCYAIKSKLQSLTFSGVMSRIEKLMP